ncbi:prepilin-type N-terminal cleavage/methylation domain-containing protein [Anaerobacillus alkaliphilus]|nr:prepilin-type N-terminal cleavage/methylation domain-containing protein [Anaerobacillus alkaliphilus]
MDNYLKSKEGFTLLEVLLALVILAILIVPVFNFFMQSMNYSKYNQQKNVATYAARNALTYLENVEFETYKTFYETIKTMDNLTNDAVGNKIITSELLCEGKIDAVENIFNVAKLHPIITDDGRLAPENDLDSKTKCLSFFKPEINGIEYSIILQLKDFEPSIDSPIDATTLQDLLISVEVHATWVSGLRERKTETLRGFISHEKIRYKLF